MVFITKKQNKKKEIKKKTKWTLRVFYITCNENIINDNKREKLFVFVVFEESV